MVPGALRHLVEGGPLVLRLLVVVRRQGIGPAGTAREAVLDVGHRLAASPHLLQGSGDLQNRHLLDGAGARLGDLDRLLLDALQHGLGELLTHGLQGGDLALQRPRLGLIVRQLLTVHLARLDIVALLALLGTLRHIELQCAAPLYLRADALLRL